MNARENWAGRLPQFTLEKRYRRKDGRCIWVKVTVSSVLGCSTASPLAMAVVEDITERKQAEARMREYEKVVESLQEMILVVDRDYRYLIANQAFLSYHGLRRDQVVGHSVSELVGQETFQGITKHNQDECFRGRVVQCELSITFSKLGRRDIFASYLPIEGPAGIDRIAVVLEDVTERKRAEGELQRSFQQLHALNARLQSVREEERATLARELHDELGQALTAIRLDLVALKATPRGDQQWRGIDAISGLIDATMHSVRRISTKLRPGILDDLGLADAVEWAAEEFQARTGIRCLVRLAARDLAIEKGGATALFRIVQESLTNVARHAGATHLRIELSEDSGFVSLQVMDNGRGIAQDQISSAGSLGILGMRERALLLGGEFFIGNTGSGTVVRVRIPIDRRKAGPATRILIADDHAIVRRGLKEILSRELEGVVCGEAEDAAGVLTAVQSGDWNLVILDISMPGRSGLDVLRELKAARPNLPVLVLSMHPEDQYAGRAIRAGASGYMNKESAPEELIKAVREMLAGRYLRK